ncbi:MAG: type II secretion system F family protein [Proteobacteria bacterium]|nr:type II secretion system F family protein [Pseudomonadota bacterium]
MTGWALLTALAVIVAAYSLVRGARRQAARHESRLVGLSAHEFADLFLFIEPAALVKWSSALFVAVLALAFWLTDLAVLAMLLAVGTWFVPGLTVRWLRKQRQQRIARQFPDGVDALAMALRSGLSLNQAISVLAEQQPAPLGQEFALVSRRQRVGISLDEALQAFAGRVPLDESEMLVATVRIARETGGTLAESLDRLAATLRRKLALQDKIRALTAQGRIQGIIVALLPPFLMVVLLWLQPASMWPLFTTAVGWMTLIVIGLLELLGIFLIRRIVRIEI